MIRKLKGYARKCIMKAFWQGNFLSSESRQQSLPVVGSYMYNPDLQQMYVYISDWCTNLLYCGEMKTLSSVF